MPEVISVESKKNSIYSRFVHDQKGQALAQVAVAMVVIIAAISLSIEVGHVYGERRRMQNAADAGALAGARQLCLVSDEDLARAEASRYMQENGVLPADIAAEDIEISGNVVNVTARQTTDTFIARVIGVNTVDVGAPAAAACGAATSACGLFPIAFSNDIWQEIYDDGAGCGSEFYVWNDDTDGSACQVDGEPSNNMCDCYDCDLDNNGEDDFVVNMGEGRAWLDYSGAVAPYTDACTQEGCGASELSCHIRNDVGTKVDLPTCVAGDSGVKAGVKDDIESRIGDTLGFALYDSLGCPSGNNCGAGTTYYVTSFGCMSIVGWEQNFELKPKPEYLALGYKNQKGKAIRGRINCGNECTTGCGGTDGTPAEPWQLTAVSITQ
jgi:Flp pilus assembly protein TadG